MGVAYATQQGMLSSAKWHTIVDRLFSPRGIGDINGPRMGRDDTQFGNKEQYFVSPLPGRQTCTK